MVFIRAIPGFSYSGKGQADRCDVWHDWPRWYAGPMSWYGFSERDPFVWQQPVGKRTAFTNGRPALWSDVKGRIPVCRIGQTGGLLFWAQSSAVHLPMTTPQMVALA